MNKEQLWDYIKSHDDDKNILTAGVLPLDGNCYATHPTGLQYCHAYSTVHTYEFTENGKTERLVLVRNPWGHNNYNGEYRWGSSKWTKKAKDAVNYQELYQQGGFFMMSLDEYYEGIYVT